MLIPFLYSVWLLILPRLDRIRLLFVNTENEPDSDPDPAFLTGDTDPDPGQTLNLQKVHFYIKNIRRRYNGLFEKQETSFIVNFGKFPCCWIWIWFRIPNTDPGKPDQCGSGSTTLMVPLRSSAKLKACLTTSMKFLYHFSWELFSETVLRN
jgi:hypothetical protein